MRADPLLDRRSQLKLKQIIRTAAFLTAASALSLILTSCAKYPTGPAGQTTKRIDISMTVAGTLNPGYVYIFAFNPSSDPNPTTTGPLPVVAPPWGNGFVAGNCTYFVQWTPSQIPTYTIYQFTDPLLNNYLPVGTPVTFTDVPTGGGHKLEFSIDLSQIAPDLATANSYKSLQLNLLTMDTVPRGSGGSKNFDSIGDDRTAQGISQWLTIPLTTTGTYTNATYGIIEPTGDVISDNDPALDISDFSIQVFQQ